MKKIYNKDTLRDMPIEDSFSPAENAKSTSSKTTASKPKINVIGKKSTGSTTASKGKSTAKSTTLTRTKEKDTTKPSKGPIKKLNTRKSSVETTSPTAEETKKTSTRTKLANTQQELSDLEKLNEDNLKTYRYKSKRNKFVIAILSVLLAITIAIIVTYAVITKLKTNCNMILHGQVEAVYVVDGQTMNEFRAPSNLQGNRILKLDIGLKIKDGGMYNIKFKANVYKKGVLINNTLIYKHNTDLFYDGYDGYYYSLRPISGDQTIELCEGIILDYYYEESLNVDNFKLNFHTYITKV